MQRVGVARFLGTVGGRVMRQQPVEDHQRSRLDLQRNGLGGMRGRPGRGVDLLHPGPAALAHKALAQHAARAAVAAGLGPQAAVVQRGVFQREPEGGDRDRVAVEEAGVLVPAHLAADARLLEDEHALPDLRPAQAHAGRHLAQRLALGEGAEDWVEVVHRVADLVDRQFLGHAQPALLIEGLLLEKATHLVAAVEEVVVDMALLFFGREDRALLAGVESVDDLQRAFTQRGDLGGGLEAGEHKKALFGIAGGVDGHGKLARSCADCVRAASRRQ
mmetsp:Transcript_18066/g.43126  ORF Transcript_18066/g.43126 Transcript_18066/m.43126 type:complete len:275 (+) Transcript_18066:542-1366(+)